jgi:hypothetical protein
VNIPFLYFIAVYQAFAAEARRTLLQEFVALEFLSQCAAVYAENAGSLALVTLRIVHDSLEQGALYFAHDKLVKITGAVTVQGGEIVFQCVFGMFAEWFLALGRFEVA